MMTYACDQSTSPAPRTSTVRSVCRRHRRPHHASRRSTLSGATWPRTLSTTVAALMRRVSRTRSACVSTGPIYYSTMRAFPLLVLGVVWLGCNEDAPPPKVAKPKPPKPTAGASAWKEVETPVPVGKKLACGTLFPAEKLGPLL